MSQIIQAGSRQPLLLSATGGSMLGNASTTPLPGPERTPSSKGSAIDLAAFGPDQPPGEGVGLVLGRFLPLHLGSQFLIEFAAHYVAQLTVLIRSQDQDAIPGDLRIAWLRELFPEVSVILVHDDRVPKKGDEDSSFFSRWNQKIRQQVPTGLDYLFASEKFGSRLAKMLGAQYVPVDPARTTVPISASQIRANPLAHWAYLPPCVRPFYLRRVCLLGPEAPGKTALAAQLASHFGTCYVGDYARILRELQNELTPADVQRLARAQWAAEVTLARQANRVLFLDADLMALRFWSEHQFGWCPDWICQAAQSRPYDLYLVPDLDAPLVGEPWHGQTEAQRAFWQRCVETLEKRGLATVRLSGSWEERRARAVAEVEALLRKKP